MYCDYCGKKGAICEVAISEDEAIHLCWFCEKRKDEIAEMFKGEKKIGCQDCKHFVQETYHQTGLGTRHFYRCRNKGMLDKPKKECEEAEVGKPERWTKIL